MRIGIDIGGTKTEVIALDEMGKCLLRRRVGTPADDYSAMLQTIVELVVSTGTRCEAARGPGTKLLRYQRMVADARFPTTGSSQVFVGAAGRPRRCAASGPSRQRADRA